jgi:hypothetical protein
MEEQWDLPGLEKALASEWQIDLPLQQDVAGSNPSPTKTFWKRSSRRPRSVRAKVA